MGLTFFFLIMELMVVGPLPISQGGGGRWKVRASFVMLTIWSESHLGGCLFQSPNDCGETCWAL